MKVLRFLHGLLFIALLSASPVSAAEAVKIGFVDLSRLFDEYHKTKTYDEKLEAKHKEYETERTAKMDKIREQQNTLSLLAADKKAQAEADIEALKADLIEFDRQKKADLTKDRNEVIREILLEIEKTVSTYAEQENFSVILNDRVLIYGNQALNVTEKVLQKLNAAK